MLGWRFLLRQLGSNLSVVLVNSSEFYATSRSDPSEILEELDQDSALFSQNKTLDGADLIAVYTEKTPGASSRSMM